MGIKYSVNEKFFASWNPTMAYVLGFMYADGCIYRSSRGHYIVATSTDEEIIINLKKWLDAEHSIIKTESSLPNRKIRFTLRVGNKMLYNDLLKLGVYPNKSLTLRMPEIPTPFLHDFIRGLFDGDGCVSLFRSKGIGQGIILRRLSIIFTSGSLDFVDDLLGILRKNLSLRQEKIYRSHRSFQIRFNTSDSVILFKFIYKSVSPDEFFLRKFNIFREYFALRPQRVDKEIGMILQYVGNGHVAKKLTQRSAKPQYAGANPAVAS